MIVVMKVGTPEFKIARVNQEFSERGLTPEKIVGKHKVVIGLVGETAALNPLQIQEIGPLDFEDVLRVEQPFKRASLEFRHGDYSEVSIFPPPTGPVAMGKNHPLTIVAGPCSVENEAMIIETATTSKSGWSALSTRGGLQTSDFSLCFPRSWGKCVRTFGCRETSQWFGNYYRSYGYGRFRENCRSGRRDPNWSAEYAEFCHAQKSRRTRNLFIKTGDSGHH